MRYVNRLARKGRSGGRRRPPPRLWVARLRRWGLVVLGAVAATAAAYSFGQSSLAARLAADLGVRATKATAAAGFVIRRVYSEGRVLADDTELAKSLEPYYGQPILMVELNELKERVEALPWVRSASVGRRLPDTLWVRLDEHRPIARWQDGNRQVLVSDAQEVFRVKNAGQYRELPLLFGKGAPSRAHEVLRLVAAEPELAPHVTGARLVGGRRWDIYLDGRIEVRLPAKRPQAAWRRLAAEQRENSVVGRAVTAIDLRNPDWLTLEIPDAAIEPAKEPRA
jgi:cell division protein FtsQ